MFRKPLFFLSLLAVTLLSGPRSFAHPMGNFSVNHYSKISLESEGIRISYIIDLAEIPTYQELQQGNVTAEVADPAVTRFIAQRGAELGRGLSLLVDGRRLSLRLMSSQVIFAPGAGGLPTMKMGFVYSASYPPNHQGGSLQYADDNFPGHAGWKEIVAVANPAVSFISSTVPSTDRSAGLTNYPTDLLNSPPQQLSAAVQFHYPIALAKRAARARKAPMPPSPAAKPEATASLMAAAPTATAEPLHLQANQQATPRNAFTELITSHRLGLWFLITAAFIAFGFGALHALEPGHGKTIVGAYLVGSRGTARHALLLGLIVTVSHTAGVFALGAVTLYASRYIVPEQLYPWLGVFSGLTIAGLGGYMFLRRWSGLDLDHSHTAGQLHGHWFRPVNSVLHRPSLTSPSNRFPSTSSLPWALRVESFRARPRSSFC